MIVAKFGGTSLADAQQFQKVAAIVQANPERQYIVPSAPGKRSADDIKITDQLINLYHTVKTGEQIKPIVQTIKERYVGIGFALNLPLESFLEDFDDFAKNLSKDSTYAEVVSRGEHWSAMLLSECLGLPFLDATEVVRFSPDGKLDAQTTSELMAKIALPLGGCVMPGFYGADAQGNIHLFDRGGSDISGALLAQAVNADQYENWTDINGVRSADPRIIPDAKFINQMTYRELRELSYMGASVLHEDAVFPVRSASIPTRIRNTNDPLHPGTLIYSTTVSTGKPPSITGIAGKKGFSFVMLEKARMNVEVGFARRTLQVFEDLGLSIDHMPTGIDEMCVILSTDQLAKKKEILFKQLEKAVAPDRLSIQNNKAMVAVVGHSAFKQNGVSSRLYTALCEAGIQISTTLMSPSGLSIIVGIREEMLNHAILTLYNAFIRD
ncbi:MAG: aspartate kinase [Christensenellales bacterium]